MPKRNYRRQDTYYQRRQASENQSGQKTANIGFALGEALGIPNDWEIADAREPGLPARQQPNQNADLTLRDTTPAFQTQTAPTINPPRPRAKKIAYSRQAQKLVVKFRDGTWWEYNGISPQIWNELKASPSTGRFLNGKIKNSQGIILDTWGDMGPFNPNEMPPETRVMFNG